MDKKTKKLLDSFYDQVQQFNDLIAPGRKFNDETYALALKIFKEEVEETIFSGSTEDTVDGVCDMLVTAFGLIQLKPEIFRTDLYEAAELLVATEDIELQKISDLCEEAAKSTAAAREAVRYAVALFLLGLAEPELNLADNMQSVLDSNMSKFTASEEVAADSVIDYAKQGVDAYYEEINGVFKIKRKDGKLLKPLTWTAPEIKILVVPE